jgi:hypothetical protein
VRYDDLTIYDDEPPLGQITGFREEMRELPFVARITIHLSMACMVLLFVQCVFIMPVILLKYGWGFDGGFVK